MKTNLLNEVTITGHFWKNFIDMAITQVIPYQWEALNDRIEGAEPSYCMRNFRVASGKEKGEFGGRVFQDSDVAKWLEAVAYSLMVRPDAELESIADGAIDDIVAAQQPDGYLNTYYILNGLDKRFTNLMENHELYCLGHFLEAAVAYYYATKKDKLLKALIKYVDLVDSLIGSEEGKIHGYPGHQEIELALVKLYGITQDEKHLKLAKYFIDERGKEPLFFREEIEKHSNYYHWKDSLFQFGYYQAGETVREQQSAIGHSVRALYMYAGMADVAYKTNDASLMEACCRLWKDVTRSQMYITGGVGSSYYGEAFTFSYDLPNDTMYAETCASIALAFFARRMLEYDGFKSEYADVLEQALYNGIISGMSADGKSFFYVNPLEVVPESTKKDQHREHVKIQRQKWFSCSCCPPNLARILTSLGDYLYAKNKNTFYVNLFVDGTVQTELDCGSIGFEITTEYPWEGTIKLKVTDWSTEAVLAVRLPGWCENYSVNLSDNVSRCDSGYLLLSKLNAGDEILIEFDMPVTIVEANPRVRENIGKVAIRRGSVVYCLEEIDNGADLHRIFLDRETEFTYSFNKEFFGGAVLLESQGLRLNQDAWEPDVLYRRVQARDYKNISLKWIPYYLWANREPGEMCCWIKTN